MMMIETGTFALILSLLLAMMQATLPLWGAARHDRTLAGLAPSLAVIQFLFIAYAFGVLTMAHVSSDFSVANVVENSHSAKPLIYKISGVWGSHEGSMMLWVLILAGFGAAVALTSRNMPYDLRAHVLAVQGWIGAAFLLFILFTSNPFARVGFAPAEGNDLNPVLQDPGLAIHPPLLYIGYVGFSIVFSFAAGALLCGRLDSVWARYVRPWGLAAWLFLTLGIAMGSYWAYYTLGWGGFWFWDPVENASLMPWLAGTALVHSVVVMEKRDALKVWTVFLAVLTFSLSLLGTFLVRSGALTSVHAFASSPERGFFILGILVFFIGGALILFAVRARELKAGGLFAPISREGALVVNNLLLTGSCATVVVGTLYPLILEGFTGEKISVGAPFFNICIAPFAFLLVLFMPIGSLLAWKRGDLAAALQRLIAAFALAAVAGLIALALTGGPWVSVAGEAVAVYLICGSFADILARIWPRKATPAIVWARAWGLPSSAWGSSLTHAGFGLTLLGLAATGWGVEKITVLTIDIGQQVGPYTLTLRSSGEREGPNYHENYGRVEITRAGVLQAVSEPARRFFPSRNRVNTEAGIVTLGLGQVYISLTEPKANGSFDARLYWKPLVALIWLGALIMAFGGLLSLSDRRVRIGFSHRAASHSAKTAHLQSL